MPYRPLVRGAVLVAAALLAACIDESPVRAPVEPPTDGSRTVAVLKCTASVASASLGCAESAPPGGGASRSLVLGGQGIYVRLESSGTSYDAATETFQSTVTVRNLLSQAIGTTDGTVVTGVKVFFAQEPAVTGGTGTVEVANPDGIGSFTGSQQPYFSYAEKIAPQQKSLGKVWRWTVPQTVQTFSFYVYVETAVAAEGAVLRLVQERFPAPSYDMYAVWMASPDAMFAAGSRTLMSFDGSRWRTQDEFGYLFYGVWGHPSRAAWAVGRQGVIMRFDGASWQMHTLPTTDFNDNLYDVWGSSPGDVWAVGAGGRILHWDGASWTAVASPTTATLYALWALGPNQVYAGGDNVVLRWDGAQWTATSLAQIGISIQAIFGHSASDIYVGGVSGRFVHFDGTTWTRIDTPIGSDVTGIWGSAPGTVYVSAANGSIRRYTGGGYTGFTTVSPVSGRILRAMHGLAGEGMLAVGGAGAMMRSPDGERWTGMPTSLTQTHELWAGGGAVWALGANSFLRRAPDAEIWTAFSGGGSSIIRGVWGADSANVWAVGDGGAIRRFDGASWTSQATPHPGVRLRGVWGTSAADVWAVADSGIVIRYDGTSWSHVVRFAQRGTLRGVWASAPDNVYAVDSAAVYHWDGSLWRRFTVPTGGRLETVWGTGPNDVWIGAGGGGIVRFDGTSWSQVVASSGSTFPYVDQFSGTPNNVYAIRGDGVLLHWDGAAWRQAATGLSGAVSVAVESPTRLYVSTSSGIFRGTR